MLLSWLDGDLMVMFRLHYGLFLGALLFSASLFSEGVESLVKTTPSFLHNTADTDSEHQLTFPLNGDNHISLVVTLPIDLKREKEQKDSSNPNQPFIFFHGNFTFITLSSTTFNSDQPDENLLNPSFDPITLTLDSVTNTMKKETEVTVLENGKKDNSGYREGYRIVKRYSAQGDKLDVAYIYVVCGPHDAVIIIYTMRVHGSETVDTLVQKLREAMKAQVKIVNKSTTN